MADVKELNINNTTYDIKAKSVVDNNSGAVKFWTGTKAQYDAIVTKDSKTQYICTDTGEIYLGDVQIGGGGGASRNIGEIVASTIPLTDAGLHLLDGALISGSGSYSAFVDYIADLYDNTTDKYSNVTKVGALADTDGVLSGFSASNYAKLPVNFNPQNNTWEMVFKVKTGSDLGTSSWITGGTVTSGLDWQVPAIGYEGTHKPTMYLSSNGSSWDIAQNIQGTTDLQINTDYWYKLEFTGSAYNLYLSTDGTTYGLEATVTSSTSIYNANSLIGIGCNFYSSANSAYWKGLIDLNESYININGSRWWTGRMASGFTEENAWQSSVSTYGVCGKFVYDSVNNTVRLPKRTTEHGTLIKSYVNGTDWYRIYYDGWCEQGGYYNTSGIHYFLKPFKDTNYTLTSGSYTANEQAVTYIRDALYNRTTTSFDTTVGAAQSWYACGYVNISDYQQSPIYEYIVLATSTKTDIQVDIDEVVTDLNGKADVDLTNLNNTGKIAIAHNAMPSDTYIDLTLGASETVYTAPADGWFSISKIAGSDWYTIYLRVLNENETAVLLSQTVVGYRSTELKGCLPVRKGQKFQMWYNVTGATNYFRFVYARGSESEAN